MPAYEAPEISVARAPYPIPSAPTFGNDGFPAGLHAFPALGQSTHFPSIKFKQHCYISSAVWDVIMFVNMRTRYAPALGVLKFLNLRNIFHQGL